MRNAMRNMLILMTAMVFVTAGSAKGTVSPGQLMLSSSTVAASGLSSFRSAQTFTLAISPDNDDGNKKGYHRPPPPPPPPPPSKSCPPGWGWNNQAASCHKK